jgi:hypothetical protein
MAEPQELWPVAVRDEGLAGSRRGGMRPCRDPSTRQARPRRSPDAPVSMRWPPRRVPVMVVVAWPTHCRMQGYQEAARRRGG